jgi:glycosyl transferase family 25
MCEHIDHIIYINLNKRTDRREQIEQELNDFGLSYERFEAIETPGFGCLGCGLSHLEVLKIAKERNYKNILILEDDFTFVGAKEKFYNQINSFFNLNLDYDVCFLAYNLQRYEALENNIVNKVLEAQTTAGYLVHKNYYDKLIQLYEKTMPILYQTRIHWIYAPDQIWKLFQETDNWYYFIDRIGKQKPGYSDIGEQYVSLDC